MELGKFLLAFLLLLGQDVFSDETPEVETPLGKIRGFTMTSRSGRVFNAFQGVPYAKPPVGQLRFKAPQEAETWTGILVADGKNMPKCLQKDLLNQTDVVPVGNEDCLYLTIYTHNFTRRVPVLFYIHGGAFIDGDAPGHGPQFFMDEDIVIVGVQYRLNLFGFLSFEDNELPGNMGMKDQVMALRWVQKYIHLFGGDPNSVTIIGESAGGASVYHHLVSPMSKGLYHNAISESGSSYSLWALPPPGFAKSQAERIAVAFGCSNNSKEAVPCLMEKDGAELLMAFRLMQNLSFSPVFESGKDAFLTGPISKWQHNPVPLIIGMTSAEGLLATFKYSSSDGLFKQFTQMLNISTAQMLLYERSSSKPDEITKSIAPYYGLDKDLTLNDWVNITTVFSHSWFSISILDGVFNHSGTTYAYYFDYVSNTSLPAWFNEKLHFGAEHVAETIYIWDLKPLSSNRFAINNAEVNLSKKLTKMITNFMKHGNPTPAKNDFVWEAWTSKDQNFLYVDKNTEMSLNKSVLADVYTFWKGLKYRDLYDAMEPSGANNIKFTLWLPLMSLFVFSFKYIST